VPLFVAALRSENGYINAASRRSSFLRDYGTDDFDDNSSI